MSRIAKKGSSPPQFNHQDYRVAGSAADEGSFEVTHERLELIRGYQLDVNKSVLRRSPLRLHSVA